MSEPRRRPWVELAPCVLAIMAVANLQYTWTLFALPLKESFGARLSSIQLGFTLYIMAQTWLAPVEGWLADRFAPRSLTLVGGALVAFNWVGAGLAGSLPALYACCLAGGFGCGLVMSVGGRAAVSRFPGRRGLAVGVASMAYGLGPMLCVIPIERSIHAFGYRAAFVGWGLAQAAVVVVAALFMERQPAGDGSGAVPLGRLAGLLRSVPFALMYAAMILVATGGLLVTAQLAPMAKSFGLSGAVLMLGVGAISLAIVVDRATNAAARPFWGAISDRLGRCETMALAFVCEAAAVAALAASADHPLRFVVLSGLAFFAWGEIFSLFPALVADVFGVSGAMTNYGALFTAKGLAALLAGWGAARVIELSVAWGKVLLACAAFDLAAALIVYFPLRAAVAEHGRAA